MAPSTYNATTTPTATHPTPNTAHQTFSISTWDKMCLKKNENNGREGKMKEKANGNENRQGRRRRNIIKS